ncbi:MAG: hypothetical protein PHW72_00270 [Candidatus Pacebacteria bacterium]|nr:hypothetical protein [Candidatus Paceibacterota bacterium]
MPTKKIAKKKKTAVRPKKKPVKKASVKKTPKKAIVVKKTVKKEKKGLARRATPEGKLIGKIIHYFDNIKVAVIGVSGTLKVGDNIRVVGGENTDFSQKVDSMEIDHEKVKVVKKGGEVGLRIKERVRDGYKVYLVK